MRPATGPRAWRGLEATMRIRSERALPSSQVLDVHFRELMAHPIAMVRRIYERFDMTLSSTAEERMRRFLAENRGGAE